MEKALNLKSVMIKGRPIVIKKSNRNITYKGIDDNKKRQREEVNFDEQNMDKKKKEKYKKPKINKNSNEIKEVKSELTYKSKLQENILENKNNAYAPVKEKLESKNKMKNDDFRKFLNK